MNKRASISTFVFVMMVLVTCIYTVWSFSKQVDESGKELLDISLGIESRVMQEKTDIYLRLISEKAAVLAFNESYYRFSSLIDFEEEGKKKQVRVLNLSNSSEYNSFFSEKFKEHFTKFVEDYSEDILDKDTKNAFKNFNFYFDGKDIVVSVSEYYRNYSINGASLNSSLSFNYNKSLSNLGLPNLSLIYNINKVCSDKEKYISCLNENLPELESSSGNSESILVYSTQRDYYLGSDEPFHLEFNILAKDL